MIATTEAPKNRTCGSCRLCCKLVSTWEVGTGPDGQPYEFRKPRGKWCEHAGPGGCGIYTSPAKPWTCRIWQCLWRMGHGSDALRPDRVHFVPSLEQLNGEVHIVLYTDRKGQLTSAMQAWVDTCLQTPSVVAAMVIEPDGARHRWHAQIGYQRVLRGEGDDGVLPDKPALADPERAAMRHLLGEAAVQAPSLDLREVEAGMLRAMGDDARDYWSWADYVRAHGEQS